MKYQYTQLPHQSAASCAVALPRAHGLLRKVIRVIHSDGEPSIRFSELTSRCGQRDQRHSGCGSVWVGIWLVVWVWIISGYLSLMSNLNATEPSNAILVLTGGGGVTDGAL